MNIQIQMEVDLRRRHDLVIHLDISFHALPCAGALQEAVCQSHISLLCAAAMQSTFGAGGRAQTAAAAPSQLLHTNRT